MNVWIIIEWMKYYYMAQIVLGTRHIVVNIRLSSVVNCIIVPNYMMEYILYSCHMTCSVYSSRNFLLSDIKAGYAIECKQKWHHCQEEIWRPCIVFYHYSFLRATRMTCLRERLLLQSGFQNEYMWSRTSAYTTDI